MPRSLQLLWRYLRRGVINIWQAARSCVMLTAREQTALLLVLGLFLLGLFAMAFRQRLIP